VLFAINFLVFIGIGSTSKYMYLVHQDVIVDIESRTDETQGIMNALQDHDLVHLSAFCPSFYECSAGTIPRRML
jgi:hypothetical protein